MSLLSRNGSRHFIFHVLGRAGVWSVSKNGSFYGDYLTRAQAIRSACFAACAVESLGGSAHVAVGDEMAVVPHQSLNRSP